MCTQLNPIQHYVVVILCNDCYCDKGLCATPCFLYITQNKHINDIIILLIHKTEQLIKYVIDYINMFILIVL